MAETREVTILSVNLFATNAKKVAPTVQTGQTKTMTISKPKVEKRHETKSLTQKLTMTQDGTENERESEILEFDDSSEVDYDLDYTVQY